MVLRTGAGLIWTSILDLPIDFGSISVERDRPKPVEPGADGTEPGRIDPIDAGRAFGLVGHQPRRLEHLQVLRNRGTAYRKAACDLADRAGTRREPLEDLTACRVGKGGESTLRVSHD